MAGHGRTPKDNRKNERDVPTRGDWKVPETTGWQHGDIPKPPAKLLKTSVEAWNVWMTAWFAFFWTPDDLPGLRQVIRLYDQLERGQFQRASELRLQMDTYGITPKGQQDRRWRKPAETADPRPETKTAGRYDHLRAV